MEPVIRWLGGNCPVQAEGTLDGKFMYFRARGEHWAFHVAPTEADLWTDLDWVYEEEYPGGAFEAGWMTEDEARAFIAKGARLYAESLAP